MTTSIVTLELDRDEGMVYLLNRPGALPRHGLCLIKLSSDTYERYCHIEREYHKMQRELEAHYDQVREARKKGNHFI